MPVLLPLLPAVTSAVGTYLSMSELSGISTADIIPVHLQTQHSGSTFFCRQISCSNQLLEHRQDKLRFFNQWILFVARPHPYPLHLSDCLMSQILFTTCPPKASTNFVDFDSRIKNQDIIIGTQCQMQISSFAEKLFSDPLTPNRKLFHSSVSWSATRRFLLTAFCP